MAIRNFWIESRIDGRTTVLSGGPRNKDGEMETTIYQRHKGEAIKILKIKHSANKDGKLLTTIMDENDKIVYQKETQR